MMRLRPRIAFGFCFCGALVLACADDHVTGTGSSAASSSASSGGGGSSSGSRFKNCSGSVGGSTCTEADLKPYSECVQAQCDARYEDCYGPDYRNGTFTGPCGTFIACTQKCNCGDTRCFVGCQQDSACSTCSQAFASCSQSCTPPVCASASTTSSSGGSSGGAADACADLTACCNKMTNAPLKSACMQQAAAGSADRCAAAASSYEGGNFCQ